MIDGLEHVRQVIGTESVSAIPDSAIQDVLWETYFDVQRTVEWALEEQERKKAAREHNFGDDNTGAEEYYHGYPYNAADAGELRPGVPKIMLAQQQGNMHPEMLSPSVEDRRLSTITERTEYTEMTPHWRTRNLGGYAASSSDSTSYGQVIDTRHRTSQARVPTDSPIDPNLIPVSPSGSAVQRLSVYEPPPSNTPSESRSPQSTPIRPPSVTVPPEETLPDIPDYSSRKSDAPLPVPDPIPVPIPPKRSKLASLASSRSSAVSLTESSRSSGTSLTGSIKTFPALRPSAQSEKPPSSDGTPSAVSKSLPPLPSRASSITPSSTSAHVRRAIEAAMQLEALDRGTPKPERQLFSESSPSSRPSSESSRKTPTPRPLSTLSRHSPTDGSNSKQLPTESQSPKSGTPEPIASFPPTPTTKAPSGRTLSKLALLAQAKQSKIDPRNAPKLPKTTTEYLTPIANGSSVTTAITTSYQSLYSLTDPSKPAIIPKLDVVPLGAVPPPRPEAKQSKLAQKIRKAQEKHNEVPREEVPPQVVPPIFKATQSSARASPSAFASLLISDIYEGLDSGVSKDKPKADDKKTSSARSVSMETVDSHPNRRLRTRRSVVVPEIFSSSGFAFDGPSPDDIVFNARKGTSLAQQKNTTSSSSRAGAGKSYPSKA
ncbi:hypothetical protein BDQ17DRAFT_75755 [Cyathus striatus]|nr:hypothetical protein BDQ17DRAFT_75755 [Cyathus striatus]